MSLKKSYERLLDATAYKRIDVAYTLDSGSGSGSFLSVHPEFRNRMLALKNVNARLLHSFGDSFVRKIILLIFRLITIRINMSIIMHEPFHPVHVAVGTHKSNAKLVNFSVSVNSLVQSRRSQGAIRALQTTTLCFDTRLFHLK